MQLRIGKPGSSIKLNSNLYQANRKEIIQIIKTNRLFIKIGNEVDILCEKLSQIQGTGRILD